MCVCVCVCGSNGRGFAAYHIEKISYFVEGSQIETYRSEILGCGFRGVAYWVSVPPNTQSRPAATLMGITRTSSYSDMLLMMDENIARNM